MEGGEEKSSGGGDRTRGRYPVGFRFKPTDEELVEYYLLPKLQGRPIVPNDAIIEADVYECDPEILIQKYRDRGEDHWYFLSPRSRKYQRGVRPSRRTADERGRWKPSTGRSEKKPEASGEATPDQAVEKLCGDGTIKYYVNTLAYHVGPAKQEKKTKWLMHELTMPDYEIKLNSGAHESGSMVLDRYAMCTIYISPLTKWHKNEGGDSRAAREAAASSSKPGTEAGQGTSSAPATMSDQQAGKRPVMEQQQPGHAAARKRARQARGGPPAPVHGNGGVVAMGVPPLGAGATGFYTVPGQPAQVPWPPLTSSRLQGPVQLPQQRTMMYQQHNGMPVYHVQGQAPVQGLAGSSLRSPVTSAHNAPNRAMVMRQPLPPSAFELKMMLRPQNNMMNLAAGQTHPPPKPRRLPDVDMNDPEAQRVFSQLAAAMKAEKSAAQQQGSAASNLPAPPPQQQPTFYARAKHSVGASAAVPHTGRGGQQQRQQHGSAMAMSVSVPGGAVAPAEATPASDNALDELATRRDADVGSGNGALDSSNADQF